MGAVHSISVYKHSTPTLSEISMLCSHNPTVPGLAALTGIILLSPITHSDPHATGHEPKTNYHEYSRTLRTRYHLKTLDFLISKSYWRQQKLLQTS